jgi:hypothetical protein
MNNNDEDAGGQRTLRGRKAQQKQYQFAIRQKARTA